MAADEAGAACHQNSHGHVLSDMVNTATKANGEVEQAWRTPRSINIALGCGAVASLGNAQAADEVQIAWQIVRWPISTKP